MRKEIYILAVLLILLLFVIACGEDDGRRDEPSDSDSDEASDGDGDNASDGDESSDGDNESIAHDGDDPTDGDEPIDGDVHAGCSSVCSVNTDTTYCLDDDLCICENGNWTFYACETVCDGEGKFSHGCGDAGMGFNYCLCEKSTPTDGDEFIDGDMELAGTSWYDSTSGLTWQNPPADRVMKWQKAIDYCNDLNLDGHSDWHLPTISELRSLIRGCPGTVTGGACGVTDNCIHTDACLNNGCWDCSYGDGPADGCYWPDEMKGSCDNYPHWSSSPLTDDWSWDVWFLTGSVFYGQVNDSPTFGFEFVRCVR